MAPSGDTPFKPFSVPLTGKLVTGEDPLLLGEGDFSILSNLRYTPRGIRGVLGQTKYNSTVCNGTYSNIRSAHHFLKQYPTADESHMLVQAFNAGGTAAAVYDNTTAIGSQGDFTATSLFTDTNSPKIGRFASAPYGTVVHCNGNKTKVWGGNGIKVGRYVDKAVASCVVGDGTTVIWRCIKSHTSAAANRPATGAQHLTYWVADATKSAGAWASGVDYNSDYSYDYTVQVNNDLEDSENVAVVHKAFESTADAAVLLQMETLASAGVFNDSTANNHDATMNGTAAQSAVQKKFGTYSCSLDGNSDYLTMSDHADFDFSDGAFTIDCWIYPTAYPASMCLYHQNTIASAGADYIEVRIQAGTLILEIFDGGGATVYMSGGTIATNQWTHIAVVENGDSWYLFVNGAVAATATDTDRAEPGADAFDSDVFIGVSKAAGTLQRYFQGYIDEFRISSVARWTSVFTPPTTAYGAATKSYLYIGSILPASGIRFYMDVANTGTGATVASTAYVNYWNKTTGSWTDVSGLGTFDDGTDIGTYTLAQDGIMSFTDTSGSAAPSIINDIYLYWYQVVIVGAVDTATAIKKVTIRTDMIDMVDLWDATYRPTIGYVRYNGTNYFDETMNVITDRYFTTTDGTTIDPAFYSDIGGTLSTASGRYLYFGFLERAAGIRMKFIPKAAPQNNVSAMNVEYWDGDSWASVKGLIDGTSLNNATMAQSGTVTWTPPSEGSEFKTTVMPVTGAGAAPGTQTSLARIVQYPGGPEAYAKMLAEYNYKSSQYSQVSGMGDMYYYRITVSANIDNTVWMYYCDCITAPKTIRGTRYPAVWNDRLFLGCEDSGRKNAVLISAMGTVNVFNGVDSFRMYIGDESEITAMGGVMNRFGADLSDALVVCKESETWMVYWRDQGVQPGFYYKRVSDGIGCVSPGTFVVCDTGMPVVPGVNRNVIIWLSSSGIAMYDQAAVTYIHEDIKNYFDPWRTEYIDFTLADKFYADFDVRNQEYHLYVASGAAATDINLELVYDLTRKKWYKMNRGNKEINGSCRAIDANGDYESYGFDSAGYMYRLENGQTFDGESIAYNFRTGGKALGGLMTQTTIRKIRLLAVSKNTTSSEITISDYIDTSTTPQTASPLSISDSTHRVAFADNRGIRSVHFGPGLTHELDFSITTSNETIGFEPLIVGGLYKVAREEMGG